MERGRDLAVIGVQQLQRRRVLDELRHQRILAQEIRPLLVVEPGLAGGGGVLVITHLFVPFHPRAPLSTWCTSAIVGQHGHLRKRENALLENLKETRYPYHQDT